MKKTMGFPEMLEDQKWLESIVELARQAGEAILEIYEQDQIHVTHKVDNSPLTQADMAAHRIIVSGLGILTPDIPVLSEESDALSYEQRVQWHTYWLVDPLDGTKEFLEKNGEFTVNIALIHRGVAVVGVVYVPVKQLLYAGVQVVGNNAEQNVETRQGIAYTQPSTTGLPPVPDPDWSRAFKQIGNNKPEQIRVRHLQKPGPLLVVASRRHGSEALETCLLKLRRDFGEINLINIGSSLKICLIAEGSADIYPRLAPTCEWDTAAAQAILEAAGGMLVDSQLTPLRYNSKDSLLNPDFFAMGDVTYDWARSLSLP